MILDNKEARGDAARFHIVLCSRKGRFPPQGRGAHSFLEKNPPHTPGRKAPGRFDFALDPQRHKGRGPRPPPLETNPQRPGQQPESTVTATRFPTLMGRQSCHFLGSGPLYPPPAALWCFHLWNSLPETRDGAGKTNPQGDEGRETRIKPETDRVVRSEAERTRAEIRRFGFPPRCAPHSQMRGYADLIFGYSAAGRRLPDLVDSARRPVFVLDELTALPVNSSLSVFSFDHEWPFSFPQEEKKMGIPSRMVSPCFPVPQSGIYA